MTTMLNLVTLSNSNPSRMHIELPSIYVHVHTNYKKLQKIIWNNVVWHHTKIIEIQEEIRAPINTTLFWGYMNYKYTRGLPSLLKCSPMQAFVSDLTKLPAYSKRMRDSEDRKVKNFAVLLIAVDCCTMKSVVDHQYVQE